MLSFEIAIIFPVFLYTFPWAPYKIRHATASDSGPQNYHGGFLGLGAIFDAMNIIDIFVALAHGIQAKVESRHSGRSQYGPPQQNYYALDENEGQYYPGNRSREPLYTGQEEEYGAAPRM